MIESCSFIAVFAMQIVAIYASRYYGTWAGTLRAENISLAGDVFISNATVLQIVHFSSQKDLSSINFVVLNDRSVTKVNKIYRMLTTKTGLELAVPILQSKRTANSDDRIVLQIPETVDRWDSLALLDGSNKNQILTSVTLKHHAIPKPYCCIHSTGTNNQGLIGMHYNVNSGPIEIIDAKTLRIRQFSFSGTQAPDGWILIGRGEVAKETGRKAAVLSRNGVESYCPLLEDFDGRTDLIVRLPAAETVYSISYISVYCYEFGVDFGHVNFRLSPERIQIPAFVPFVGLSNHRSVTC